MVFSVRPTSIYRLVLLGGVSGLAWSAVGVTMYGSLVNAGAGGVATASTWTDSAYALRWGVLVAPCLGAIAAQAAIPWGGLGAWARAAVALGTLLLCSWLFLFVAWLGHPPDAEPASVLTIGAAAALYAWLGLVQTGAVLVLGPLAYANFSVLMTLTRNYVRSPRPMYH